MELEAVVLNINFGKNKELMKSCRPLMEYATFVQKVKDYSKIYERDEAIEFAVKDCIQEDILKDILIKNRAEVVDMLLTEYDEEKRIRIMKNELEEARLEAQEAKQQTKRAEQQAQKAEQQAQKAEQREKKTRQLLDKILQERPELAEILEKEIKKGEIN